MIRVMHMGFEELAIIEATQKFADSVPKIMGRVNEYQQIELNPQERRVFAESALLLKMDPDEDVVSMRKENGIFKIDDREFDIDRMLLPARPEDRAPTLWNTFNTVQEKLVTGTKHRNKFELNTAPTAKSTTRKVRGIKSIDETVRVNRGLWHMMSMLGIHKGAAA